MSKYNLPPLPKPVREAVYATSANTDSVRKGYEIGGYEKSPPLFDDEQVQAYAIAAIEKDRAGQQSVPDRSGTDYAKLHAKWRKGRQELANLNRAHVALKAMLAAAPQPQPARSGCTAGTDEECTQRGCSTNCPAKPQPVQLLTGLILPRNRCPLTGAGITDPTTFGEKQ